MTRDWSVSCFGILISIALTSAVFPAHAAGTGPLKEAPAGTLTMRYVETGQGLPVVLVHGQPSDHRVWNGILDDGGSGVRYIAVDLPYFGTAPWPDDGVGFSIANEAEALASFVKGLNSGPVELVGWSFGGSVALVAAVRHPELVAGLFLYEPALATFVTDPADAKAAADDRKNMMAPVMAAAKAGNLEAAARLVPDQVTAVPGTFDSLRRWCRRPCARMRAC